MVGDRKGKTKVNEQPKKKKRTREEQDWERTQGAADAADRPQRLFQIRESRAATEGESKPDAQPVPGTPTLRRSARTRGTAQTPPARGGPCSVVDALRGLEATLSLKQTQPVRQMISRRVSQRISQGTGPCC